MTSRREILEEGERALWRSCCANGSRASEGAFPTSSRRPTNQIGTERRPRPRAGLGYTHGVKEANADISDVRQ